MLSAAIFFHDNQGVIAPLSPIARSDFLPVDTGDVKGDQEVLQSNTDIHLIVPFYFGMSINTKMWFSSHQMMLPALYFSVCQHQISKNQRNSPAERSFK